MYSNNILNVQESSTILNACTKKKVWKLIEGTTYTYTYIYIYIIVRWVVSTFGKSLFKVGTSIFRGAVILRSCITRELV